MSAPLSQSELTQLFSEKLVNIGAEDLKTAKGQQILEILKDIEKPHTSPAGNCWSPLQLVLKDNQNLSFRPGQDIRTEMLKIMVPKVDSPVEFWSRKKDGSFSCKREHLSMHFAASLGNSSDLESYFSSIEKWDVLANDYQNYVSGKPSKTGKSVITEKRLEPYIHHFLSSEVLFAQTPRLGPWVTLNCVHKQDPDSLRRIQEFLALGAPVEGKIILKSSAPGIFAAGTFSFLSDSVRENNVNLFVSLLKHGANDQGVQFTPEAGPAMTLDQVIKQSLVGQMSGSFAHQIADIYQSHLCATKAQSMLSEMGLDATKSGDARPK